MPRSTRFSSNTIRTVGALLPHDVLLKVVDGEGLTGLQPGDYGLDEDSRLRDVINDSWNKSKQLWWQFQKELRTVPKADAATAVTRDRWMLPFLGLMGFDTLSVNRSALRVGNTDYPISHSYAHSPIHLMGARVELDGRVAKVPGAARLSPHSITQQFLNRSDEHLWGVVANGRRLRLLRDSVSLTRQAYVEFDLEAMFNGEVFPDFNLLYRIVHASRFESDRPETCCLERWIASAREDGIAAREQLRGGVQSALTTLGNGFLAHPENSMLRGALTNGKLDDAEMYRHLLRLVYRLLFLFVAEDRDLLHTPDTAIAERERYERFYSTRRLRQMADQPTVTQHDDLWAGLTALMAVLGAEEGEPALGLPALGSFLWAPDAIDLLTSSQINNAALLEAFQHLAYMQDHGNRRRIDFGALGSEELGSVYESLLELHPRTQGDKFSLETGAGSERKTSGSYYTSASLISELLDSALDPVVERAAASATPEESILKLKIVDPAAGSGHFLISAAHRMAKALAEVRSGEPEPPNEEYRSALRDVIAHCIYAVDQNELAVELCKVSLWIETLEPGKPLSFLDHHVLVGNSLFGATPDAIADGIPDTAFKSVPGDDKSTVTALKRRNKAERRSGQPALTFFAEKQIALANEIEALDTLEDDTLETVRVKESMLQEWKQSKTYSHAKLIADSWCAAFPLTKNEGSPVLTHGTFLGIRDDGNIEENLAAAVHDLTGRHGFFHWHLAFPQVFGPERLNDSSQQPGRQGFDVVLGNPPWDQVQYDARETFATSHPEIATASTTAKRNKLLAGLEAAEPSAYKRYLHDVRTLDGFKHFAHGSQLYPLSSVGRLNTAPLFVERMWSIVDPTGRVGVATPTGIATDSFTQGFFNAMVERKALVSLYDFENKKKLFPGVDSRVKFCLLTLTGENSPAQEADFVFFAHDPIELKDPDRRFSLTAEDFALLNPNTRTCPVFRTQRDAEITKAIYRRVPVLIDETKEDGNPWGASFQLMFMMNTDSHLFKEKAELEAEGWHLEGNVFRRRAEKYLPLYEGKMIHQYDHQFASYSVGEFSDCVAEQKRSTDFAPLPRYWVHKSKVDQRIRQQGKQPSLGFRDVCRSTDSRTVISALIPRSAVGNNLPLLRLSGPANLHRVMLGLMNSFVFDFIARQKVGGAHLNFYILKQLPVPLPPTAFESDDDRHRIYEAISERVAAISVGGVAPDPQLANEHGQHPETEADRMRIRSEIDALAFLIYGVDQPAASYILDTFPIVQKHDVAEFGNFKTKQLVLQAHGTLRERFNATS